MTARRLFFKHQGLLSRANNDLLSGISPPPPWYDAVRRVPPPVVDLIGELPPTITFPEDKLYDPLYKKLPELADEPLHLTDTQSPTVTQRIAQRWQTYIQQDKQKKNKTKHKEATPTPTPTPTLHTKVTFKDRREQAFDRMMADEDIQQMLKEYRDRVSSAATADPVTAGNINSVIHRRFKEMGLLRDTMQNKGIQVKAATRFKRDMQRALHLRETLRQMDPLIFQPRASDAREIQEEVGGERKGLELDEEGVNWLVPDFSEVHQLRFVSSNIQQHAGLTQLYQSTPNPARGKKARGRPQEADAYSSSSSEIDKSKAISSLEWALEHIVADPAASFRDYLAYCLRQQILTLQLETPISWAPYMNAVDADLWRQAKVVLRCHNVEALEGNDLDNINIQDVLSSTEEHAAATSTAQTTQDERVQDNNDLALPGTPLLLAFIDAALERYLSSVTPSGYASTNEQTLQQAQ